jgi:chaperonin GroES
MVKLIGSRVLVRVGEAAEKTASGIIIPDTKRGAADNTEGIVEAVGAAWDGEKAQPLNVKVGDTVYFSAANLYEIGDRDSAERRYIINYDDILGVVG